MSEWCSCNRLREAEQKAAKWDALSKMTIGMRPIAPKTNYERYFGTPEKVAEWLCFNLKECPDCKYFETDKCGRGYLEWLESEAK